MMEPDGPQMTI